MDVVNINTSAILILKPGGEYCYYGQNANITILCVQYILIISHIPNTTVMAI